MRCTTGGGSIVDTVGGGPQTVGVSTEKIVFKLTHLLSRQLVRCFSPPVKTWVDGSRCSGDRIARMPGRAVAPLSDREVADLRTVPEAKTAGETKASSSAGRGTSTTVPEAGGPPSPNAGRRRKAAGKSLPAGPLSLFSRPEARATTPPHLPPQPQPGVEPYSQGSQVFGFGYNGHGQRVCRQLVLCGCTTAREASHADKSRCGSPRLGAA